MKSPHAHQASIGVNHVFGSTLRLSASFIQVRSEHQIGSVNYNPIVPALGPGRRMTSAASRTSAEVFQFTDFGARYRGLLVSLRHRPNRGADFMASYTLSKAEDTSTSGTSPRRAPGAILTICWGSTGFDPSWNEAQPIPTKTSAGARRTATSPPEFRSRQWSRPAPTYTPLAGADLNGMASCSPIADRCHRSGEQCDAEQRAAGNEFRVDLRVLKRIGVSSSAAIDVMVDIFNLFNRTNFTEINNVFGPGSFPREPATRSDASPTAALEKAAPRRDPAGRQTELLAKGLVVPVTHDGVRGRSLGH